jgi:hypothetical protein
VAGEDLPAAVGTELVTDALLEFGLRDALLQQREQADKIDVVLRFGGRGADDGAE